MFGLFYAILKDKLEWEQIPKLESETISLCKPDGTYFLRVKKNEKAITACCRWAHENRQQDDISISGDPRLSRIQQNESIFFSSASTSSENPLTETEPKPYN